MLKGKVAIVTGAGRGIGKAVSLKFAEAGASLVLCSRHVNQELTNQISDMGVEVFFCTCDVTDINAVRYAVEETQGRFGRIDILANIAGISPKSTDGMKIPFYELSAEQWHEVMETNLNGAFYFSKAVVPIMMKQRSGRIINMSSIVGLTNSEHGPASAAYVVSKTGLIGLTRAMAYDLAPYGITVNAVAAGRISTDMSSANHEYYNELHKKLIPMHQFGTAEEVAELFLFYATDKSAYITGETTNITGGWYI